MDLKKVSQKLQSINKIIALLVILLIFSSFYFLYFRQRGEVDIYVYVSNEAVPYWIADYINVNDKDLSTFNRINAIVLDKKASEAGGKGIDLSLLLKVKVVQDRSGVYLFKNKPLLAGGQIDLMLSKVRHGGKIIYLGTEPPKFENKKFILTIIGRGAEPEIAEAIIIGDEVINNKNEVLAKVIDKRVTFHQVRSDTAQGEAVVSYDQRKRDIIVKVEIESKKVVDRFYFQDIWKVKLYEDITLHFKNISLYNFKIIGIDEVK